MAVIDLGNLGTGSASTAGTTIAITNSTGNAIPAGTLIHITGTWDNINSVTAPTITSSTVGGVAPTANHGTAIGQGVTTTAGSGVWHQCFRVLTTSVIATGGTVATLTSNQSAVKRAACTQGFSGATATLRGTVTTAVNASGAASVTSTGTALVATDLVIGSVSAENNAVPTGDSDTTNGSWSTITGTATSGGAANTNVAIGCQAKVVSATGAQTYNLTTANDCVACIYSVQAIPEPAVTQAAYRFYADGTESGSTALAAQDTAYTADLSAGDVNLQVRVRLQETAGSSLLAATDDWRLQWEKNASGSWNNVTSTAIPEALVDGYGSANVTAIDTLSDTPVCEAQSITGNGQPLLAASFWMQKIAGTPTGPVTARLFDHTGTFGVTGSKPSSATPLATSTSKDASTMPSSAGWVRFDFDGSVTLTAGAHYFIGAEWAGTAGNIIGLGYDGSSPTHPGLLAFRNSAGVWSSGAANDLIFELYTPVPPTTVVPYASANLTDAAATTNRFGAGSGSFVAGEVSEDGLVDDLGWTASNYTEVLYSVTLVEADLADADTLRFRVLRNGATTGMTYTQVPTANVTIGAGTDFLGTATLTGSGTLGTTATVTAAGTATLSGSGTLGTVQVPRPIVAATLTGAGTLTTVQVPRPAVTATFSGDGTLTTTQVPRPTQTAALSGAGTLSTTQVPRPVTTAALTGDGTLSTTATVTAVGTATLSGSGTLGAVGAVGASAFTGTATLSGDGTLTTVQVPRPAVTAALSGAGTLGTVQVPRPTQVATFSGDGTLGTIQVPRPTIVAALSGAGTLATVQVPRPTQTATLAGSGTLSTTQVPGPAVTAALSGSGSLAAAGVADFGVAVATITSQLFVGGVAVGSPVSHTLSTSSTNVYAEFTVPGLTLAQLQSGTLTVRHVVTRANTTTSATVYVDSVELLADYQTTTPPGAGEVTGTFATALADAVLAVAGTETFTGTLATTLDDTALTIAATETFTGTLTTTLADAVLAVTAAETFSGTFATALADAVLAATGAETFTGALATTLDDAVLDATGTSVAAGVFGSFATVLDDVVLAAIGLETITGTFASTLDDTALAASGLVANPVTGTLTTTLDDAVLAVAGIETLTGTFATTLADAVLNATGTSVEGVAGPFATTLDNAVLAATGLETITGTLTSTLDDTALAATGAETITGTLATTLADATLAAAGAETITGTLATTLADTVLAATGAETITGTLASTLDDATLAATGISASPATGTFATTLDDATLAAAGTVIENVTGTFATTLGGATLTAAGLETITGTLSVTLDSATLAVSAEEAMSGALATTLAGATLAAVGAVTIEGVAGTLEFILEGVYVIPDVRHSNANPGLHRYDASALRQLTDVTVSVTRRDAVLVTSTAGASTSGHDYDAEEPS